ncbi:galactofuranosyltransferase [Parabacteroides sp. PF5-9]|uniref:galactofuranosyltransferase n=1 Tax=Parabacteroides sp. PF5-9 TaxID=1742404 RepID=UPI0024741970|nr:galactofuranosyltransferase [Parabacteroides sp. PF5-9]MDH6358024.1 glycosyltransferase involved in cell wall biosynthesis [Parabacteroides sp. PF5-9]
MNLYLLKKTPSKARRDIDHIMVNMGFRNIGFPLPGYNNKFIDFFVTLAGMMKAPFVIKKGDVLVLPYNLRKYYIYLCRLTHLRGGKVVTIIHDLSSFYRKRITPQQEIKRLNHSDYLIAHNPVMKKWLETNGCQVPVGILNIFDYLSNKEPQEHKTATKPYKVLYAGTLSPKKNKFLYDLSAHITNYQLNVYGKGLDETLIHHKDHFSYKGFMSSDDLVASADGDFGLVWDGNSILFCDGPRGQYMKYNNPHKFSLYMRCGLPVIIWKEAAMAHFVNENKVGICISSLTDLDELLAGITTEEYQEMKKNAATIGKQLSEGYYFKKAFKEALSQIGYPIV